MKKTFLILIFLISIMAVSVTASAQISVYVDDNPVVSDVAPTMVSDRVLLPVRAVFEALDAEVNYIHEENKVVAVRRDKVVEHIIGTNTMTVNGEVKTFDVPSMLTNGRTLVPLRACAEAFDLEVNWDGNTERVDVKSAYRIEYVGGWESVTREYDKKGRLVYEAYTPFESEFRIWTVYRYNDDNKILKAHRGFEGEPQFDTVSCTYDNNGNCIVLETSDGIKETYEYTYDSNGNAIREKAKRIQSLNEIYKSHVITNDDILFDYNKRYKGVSKANTIINLITVLEPDFVDENKTLFDSVGRKVYVEDIFSRWEKYYYDEAGQLLMYKNYMGENFMFEYENKRLIRCQKEDGTIKLIFDNDDQGYINSVTLERECLLNSEEESAEEKIIYDDKGNIRARWIPVEEEFDYMGECDFVAYDTNTGEEIARYKQHSLCTRFSPYDVEHMRIFGDANFIHIALEYGSYVDKR